MISTTLFRRAVPALLLSGLAFTAQAQKDQIEGLWYNAEKTAKVNIFKAKDNKFYGNIVWLKEPTENGKPKTDQKNPKESLRSTPILNLQILRHFEKDGDNVYEDGEIYDPKNGKTYSCKITHKGNTLDVRGYVGISLIGRTTSWTRAQ
jgi:uncharacterized protein (DUF2147 family)